MANEKVAVEKDQLARLVEELKQLREEKKTIQSAVKMFTDNNEEAIANRQLLFMIPTLSEEQLDELLTPKQKELFGKIQSILTNG